MSKNTFHMYKCVDCVHKKVCRYATEIEEFEDKLNSIEIPDFVSVDYKCKHFEKSEPKPREIDVTSVPFTTREFQLTDFNKNNYCATCTFYINHLANGQMYVGDTPCEHCEHSNMKITCKN